MKEITLVISRTFLTAAVVCAALFSSIAAHAQAQRLADPSYFYPGAIWAKLEAAAPVAGIAVMNPNSGPGTAINPAYTAQVAEAKSRGLKVIGYVDTAYGKRSLDLVKADVEDYFTWYHVDGILLDEASNLAPDLAYYKTCYHFAHDIDKSATVVLNPGAPTLEGYMDAADIIITFESPYNDYQTNFVQSSWVVNYPASRFWHIILGATTEDQMKNAIKESKSRHAGWVYVTTFAPPANPYDKLPESPYWPDELHAIASAN